MKLALNPSHRLRIAEAPRASRRFRAVSSAPAATAARCLEARNFDSVQDVALYSCGCGLVFDAPVSTSVGCPHCGDRQAW